MKVHQLVPLLIALTLLLVLAMAAGAQAPMVPSTGGCQFGGAYDPACDVDHDGDVDIFDIQLTAGHWGHNGTWTTDHNHLGETWVGDYNPLVISGTFSGLPSAPLALRNSSGTGLQVLSAGVEGVSVLKAGNDGLVVSSAGDDGVQVTSASGDGVYVASAGLTGLNVSQAGQHGLYVGTVNGYGVMVYSADWSGLHVSSAGGDGVYVHWAGGDGIEVSTATDDGVSVYSAGDPSSWNTSGYPDGFEVAGAEGYGLFIGQADMGGVRISSTGGDGVRVDFAGGDGVEVSSAVNGLKVTSASNDGLNVGAAGQSGIYVGSATNGMTVNSVDDHGLRVNTAGNDGVSIASAGQSGVWVGAAINGLTINSASQHGLSVNSATQQGVNVVSAGNYGVYANTENTGHNFGLYTPDKVGGSNISTSSQTLIALVIGDEPLSAGDLVAAGGVAEPLPGSTVPLALVRLARGQDASGLVGVVEGRRILVRLEDDHSEEGKPQFGLRDAVGPAMPGDYVALTVLGVAQVKVEASAEIQPGQRLTASEGGKARALRTESLNGMVISEGAPVVGIALAAPQPDQDTIPVFVTLR